MSLRPSLKLVLALGKPLLTQHRDEPVAKRRADAVSADKVAIALARQTKKPVMTVDETVVVDGGSITVRVYTPEGKGPFGGHLYIHGGAFWLGTLDGYDPLCRWYAAEAGCVVVSVGYRLAPEHTYPIPVDDCYAAWLWLHDNAGRLKVNLASASVGGTSAGGALAAAVALLARDRQGPTPVIQVLEIPVTDAGLEHPTIDRYGVGYGLSRDDMAEAIGFYLADPAQAEESYASPLRTPDLAGLPPAFIYTAECDLLRSQGEAYGQRLRAAGVPVEIRRYRGHIHASTYVTRLLPSARRYLADITAVLRETHSGVPRPPETTPSSAEWTAV